MQCFELLNSLQVLALLIALFGVFSVLVVFLLTRHQVAYNGGYILHNKMTHARLLPVGHIFTYPTLALLLPLNALEIGGLDLMHGWLFGYGGNAWRLTGLHPDAYLMVRDARSIKTKLLELLRLHGHDAGLFHDAWMMTMPSYCGWEGINPLTVYFCYKADGAFWMVVLEIHNTFEERHVHFLELKVNEDDPDQGFDHGWTFPRQFHVSPFNDRSGYYTVSVTAPTYAPSHSSDLLLPPPRPTVCIRLRTGPTKACPHAPGLLKLTATLRPERSVPMTTASLLCALAEQPFVLFLTFARILYQAWILHYLRGLDVYVRPEPLSARRGWGKTDQTDGDSKIPTVNALDNGGVKWQDEGLLERFARRRVETFIQRRVEETGVGVTLVPANPFVPQSVFTPKMDNRAAGYKPRTLTVWYRSPQFFVTLFMAPSAAHASLLSSSEDIFSISSAELFFEVLWSTQAQINSSPSLSQRLRTSAIPRELRDLRRFVVLPVHPLDEGNRQYLSAAVVGLMLVSNKVAEWGYHVAHARFVPGQEPWKQWQHALDWLHGKVEVSRIQSAADSLSGGLGSVQRED